MSFLEGPQLEEEAIRQLKALGVNTSSSIKSLLGDADKMGKNLAEHTAGDTEGRVGKIGSWFLRKALGPEGVLIILRSFVQFKR